MSATYDFQNLSFDDFERLCADLMQAQLGLFLESFKIGRDGGIDLRHASAKDGITIVQCKRYAPDAFARLYGDLKDKELPKVEALMPQRYVVCTSCKLSPAQKDKLLALLSPHCQSSGDIYGADELNRIITEHSEIERRHFKLWLGSTAILQRVLNAGIFAYSEHEVETLQREISRYVVHDGFSRALSMLDETHHCIIVGIPGVGKTTAARLLLAHYLREGYEVISVTRDIDDAWKVLNRSPDSKQVIYYDDFLGQVTFAQKLEKNEDRRLLDLISHCRASKNKRFILTTRDYILDQAFGAHEPLDRARDSLKRSTVALDDYSPIVRARLLANHLQFSNVGVDVLQAIVQERAYSKIIEHPNFLPRIVEQLCSDNEVAGRTPQQFIENAFTVLNDPSRVWLRPFRQLSLDARHLAYVLASLDGSCEAERLKQAWYALNAQLGHREENSFVDVLREVEGSFTHTQSYFPKGCWIRFINPSVREFVMADLLNTENRLTALFESAISFTQLLFWRHSRYSLSTKSPASACAAHAEVIAKKAVTLLSLGEPVLTSWGGKQMILGDTRPQQVSRLNNLFEAFSAMSQPTAAKNFYLAFFNRNLSKFTQLMSTHDVTRAPEVLKVVLDIHQSVDPDSTETACESLGIGGWTQFACDFVDIRYLWEAAQLAIELSPNASGWHDQMRTLLVERSRELCDEIMSDGSADDLENASEELELVMMDFNNELDDELAMLKNRVEHLRDNEEQEDEPPTDLSSRYQGSRSELTSDIDGVFRTLIEQS
ncbi:MAG: restriction endonuclease [Comamonas thiooxydans]